MEIVILSQASNLTLMSHLDGGEFDHLVAYSLACTFENEVVSARKYETICFGSINKVSLAGFQVNSMEGSHLTSILLTVGFDNTSISGYLSVSCTSSFHYRNKIHNKPD